MIHLNKTYQKNIKTVQFHKKDWEMSDPIIELNSEEKLQLSFDELGDQMQTYFYTIIHCNADWESSDLTNYDYIQGFADVQVKNYYFSFNTTYSYVHYVVDFPNEDISPRISGNYVLRVYKDYERENIVLERRFYVVESKIGIDATIKRPGNAEFRNTGQEVDFKILYEGFQIPDPYSDIRVIIRQNGRYDNQIGNLKPRFLGVNELDYNYDYENMFKGGNEFRYFDIKSMRFLAEYVAAINFEKPYYHVILTQAEDRAFKPYYFINDINGRYYVDVQEGRDKNIEADYVFVHFSLPVDVPLADENVYVFGALTDWNMDESNQMTYNFDNHAYEITLLLKQGYYNYMYVVSKDGTGEADLSYFEGNHYETENDYSIFVYYTDMSLRYQKLIGFYKTNTLSSTTKQQ